MPAPTWAQFAGQLTQWLLPRSDVTVKAWYPTPAAMVAAGDAGYGDTAFAPGDIVEAGGYRYVVAASGATDNHLINGALVKFYALPVNGKIVPEQLGYTDALANLGAVLQAAWNAGLVVHLGAKEYLTSTTAYLRSRSGLIGCGSSISIVKAVNGFTGNVIDTQNFDTLAATDEADNGDGVLQGVVLKDFGIDGNRAAFGATVTTANGFGLRLYCRQPTISGLRITRTAGVGMLTHLTQIGNVTESYHPKTHAKPGFIRDVWIGDTGQEGFIFRGPTDIRIDSVFVGWPAGSLTDPYNAGSPKTSLHYPSETIDGMVFDNAGCEIGQIHAFDNYHGWGVKVRSDYVEIAYTGATSMTGVAVGTTMTSSGATGVLVSKAANGASGTLVLRNVSGTFTPSQTITGGAGSATISTVIARSPRFRCTDFMSERNFGQLWIGPQVRYEIEGEVHNNEGGNGSRPMVQDNSVVGGLARLKVFRGGTENGSTSIELKGAKGIWDVQAQTNFARAGHGIDLSGTDYIVTGMVERASGTTYASETSSGIVFRPGNARNRVTAKVRACARGYWFLAGSCVGNVLDLEAIDSTTADYFNATALRARERIVGRFLSNTSTGVPVPQVGAYVTPEELGYDDALANWGAVAQIAWDAGYLLSLGPREYLTSTTAYLRSKTGVVGAGERISGIKAAPGFAGNIIDTENFAARVAGGSVENDDATALGALYGFVLKSFYIDGNRPNVPAGTATTGIGVRLYCRMMEVSNVHITNCAAHGVQTVLASGNPSSFKSLDHIRIGFIDKFKVSECGREGVIFQGPGDIFGTNIAVGNNGRRYGDAYDPFNPTESLVFPGEPCHGIVFDGVGGEFNTLHVWNHPHGRGIATRGGQCRVRLYNAISEGNYGQVDISANCRMEFLGEIHDNAGGPKNSRIYYDGKNGTAFAVGNTVTGGTSGATGTIIQVVAYTSTTGYIRVSFASQTAEEVLFVDNETITASGGAVATVNRPVQVGSVPLWRDQSTYGTKAWIKHYQPAAGDGSTTFVIGGSNGSYDIQSEVGSEAGCGHGIDLSGSNVMLTAVLESRVRTAPDGTASTGLIVRSGALGANIRTTIRACNQNYLFADDGADSLFNCLSLGAVTTHFGGLSTLDASAYYGGRFVAAASGSIVNSNKWQGILDTLDLTATTAQTLTFTHNLGRTPGVSDFQAQVAKIAGTTTMPAIERIHIESATSTQVVVIVKLGSGGVGTARLVCRSR